MHYISRFHDLPAKGRFPSNARGNIGREAAENLWDVRSGELELVSPITGHEPVRYWVAEMTDDEEVETEESDDVSPTEVKDRYTAMAEAAEIEERARLEAEFRRTSIETHEELMLLVSEINQSKILAERASEETDDWFPPAECDQLTTADYVHQEVMEDVSFVAQYEEYEDESLTSGLCPLWDGMSDYDRSIWNYSRSRRSRGQWSRSIAVRSYAPESVRQAIIKEREAVDAECAAMGYTLRPFRLRPGSYALRHYPVECRHRQLSWKAMTRARRQWARHHGHHDTITM